MKKINVAKIISISWALFWIFFGILSSIGRGYNFTETIISASIPGLIFLLSALIAFINKIFGGFLLLFEGIILLIVNLFLIFSKMPLLVVIFMITIMVLPPIIAGWFFIHDWVIKTGSEI